MASVTSTTTEAMKQGVMRGEYQLVFFTPELLDHKRSRQLLGTSHYTRRVKAFVVVEAHTVKKW